MREYKVTKLDERKLKWAIKTYTALHGWYSTRKGMKEFEKAERIINAYVYEGIKLRSLSRKQKEAGKK